ncbi:LamG domain-containing protein [Microbacterium oxydans]|uniref:LamG domain-containing protein n=1 Tax=Microbacterium oxydans TaxID=82380 RepID=UPI001E4084D9|nr:LamG domain-containing protein [Microbacterium oxydans]
MSKTQPGASFRAVQQAAVASAVTSAHATGEPVPVEGMITPTEQTLAMPDGTMQYEASTLPARMEQDGDWVPVDTTLTEVGDWLEPAASAAPVRFSTGGSDQLAQVQTETGEWITERWPYGTLPTPAVDGDTATYPNVLPGVDLKMVATKTGQASIYVIKTEKAAQSTKLDDLHVIIEDAELTTDSTGTVTADAGGDATIVAGQPLWWDSSDGGNYREPGGELPPLPVAHDVETDRVLMDVGDSVAAEKKRNGDVTYPIYVDPDWSSGITASWYTEAAYPNQSYLSAGASDVLRVGIYQQYRSDMFFQFPLTAMSGKIINTAVLNTTQLSVNACGTLGAIQVHTYGPKPAGFTWNQEQAWNGAGTGGWSAPMQSWVGPGCGSAAMAVGWNVTAGVQAKAGAGNVQFAFTYSNPSAPSRRHYSRAATLIVSYNTLPNTPTAAQIASPSRACGTAAAPAAVGQKTVAVSVNQTDPDGGNVGTNFYLAKASNLNSLVQTLGSGLAAGGTKTVTFTGLVDGETYAWRGRGQDTTHHGTAYTAWCYFTVDTTKPAAPTVTAPADASFVVGQGVDLPVTGESDVAGYVYWITPTQLVSPAPPVPADGTVSTTAALPNCAGIVTNTVRWACKASTGATTLSVAPTDSLSTLWVSAYDKAGNQSPATGFPLYPDGDIGTPAVSANLDAGHAWQLSAMSSPLPSTIPDANPWIGANALDLVIPPNASTITTDIPDRPLITPVLNTNVATAGYEIGTTAAPVDASKSFTFSVWVKPAGSTGNRQAIAIQHGPGIGTVQLQTTGTGAYAFCLGNNIVTASSTARDSNCVSGGVVSGEWQLVTGVWDAANQQLRLHIGNSIAPVAVNGHVNGSGDRSANGILTFGPGPDTGRFLGLITNPVMVPGVIDHAQLARLAAFELPFTD